MCQNERYNDAGLITELVLNHLTLPTLARLAQCSRAWADAVRQYLSRTAFHKSARYEFDSSHRVARIGRCRVFDYNDFLQLPPVLERLSIDVLRERQGLNLVSSVPRGRLTRLVLTLGELGGGPDWSGLVQRLQHFPMLRYAKVWYHLPPIPETAWSGTSGSGAART